LQAIPSLPGTALGRSKRAPVAVNAAGLCRGNRSIDGPWVLNA